MKTRSTITKLIAITMAVAAMAVIGSICGTTEAQGGRLYVATDVGVFGIVHGQTACFSVAYPSTTQEGTEPVRAQAYIYDSTGRLLRQTDPVEVPPRQFRTIRFNCDDLRVEGEPDTGRVELMVKLVIELPTGIDPPQAIGSLELVDEETGGTVAVIKVKRSVIWVEPA